MREMLKNGAAQMNIALDENMLDRLMTYAAILQDWNKKMNLTAIDDNTGIVQKHFLDSLTAICTGRVGGNVIDVGTGAGFPGLVLKIAMPEIKLTLLDSLNKRLTFLKAAAEEMNLSDIEFIHGRAEDFQKRPDYFERFDTVTSRAVAKMQTLAGWCIPYVKQGGYFLALKGPLADEELTLSNDEISRFGGEVETVFNADIPDTDLHHKIICIKKIGHSPTVISKKTLSSSKKPVGKHRKPKK